MFNAYSQTSATIAVVVVATVAATISTYIQYVQRYSGYEKLQGTLALNPKRQSVRMSEITVTIWHHCTLKG